MSWLARLSLDYTQENGRSVARFSHQGPLRILQSLYPEGDATCHNVLVHPPSGLVGGDTLDMRVTVGQGAHGLVTTPGATRFYRSEAGLATQQVHARLEWLPLEALAYSGCDALNLARFELAPTAELMTWDLTALGLPNAQQPFVAGPGPARGRQPGHHAPGHRPHAPQPRNAPLGHDQPENPRRSAGRGLLHRA
jgi:urease accessory protein